MPKKLCGDQSTEPETTSVKLLESALDSGSFENFIYMLGMKEALQLRYINKCCEFKTKWISVFNKALNEVSNDGLRLRDHQEYANNLKMALAAVKQNGIALRFVGKEIKQNFNVVFAAVFQTPWAIVYADKEMQKHKQMAALLSKEINLHRLSRAVLGRFIDPNVAKDAEYWLTAFQANYMMQNVPIDIFHQNQQSFENLMLDSLKKGIYDYPFLNCTAFWKGLTKEAALSLIKMDPRVLWLSEYSHLERDPDILLQIIRSAKELPYFRNGFSQVARETLAQSDMIGEITESFQTRKILDSASSIRRYYRFDRGNCVLWKALKEAIKRLPKADKLKILQINPWCIEFISSDSPVDEDLIHAVLPNYAPAAEYFADEKRGDLEFMKTIVEISPLAIRSFIIYAEDAIDTKSYLDMIKSAVAKNGLVLAEVSHLAQQYPKFYQEIARITVNQNPLAIRHVIKNFIDAELARHVVKNGSLDAVQELYDNKWDRLSEIDVDYQITLAAAEKYPTKCRFRWFLMQAVNKNPEVIKRICMIILKKGGYFACVPESLMRDGDLVKAGIEHNLKMNIDYMIRKKACTIDDVKAILGIKD